MRLKVLEQRTVYAGYLSIVEARIAPEGGEPFRREIEHHGNAAAVLAYDPDRRCALVIRIPRAPVVWSGGPETLVEAVAGMLDGDEPAEACVRREAMEEAGVRLDNLEPVASVWSTPGVSAERIWLFLAAYRAQDRTGEGGGLAGENEHIQAMETPLAALWADTEAGRIQDLKTLALIYALRVRRAGLFDPAPARPAS